MSADAWRVQQLEHDVEELDDIVRGVDAFSHERRILILENERIAAALAKETLAAYRKERDRLSTRLREWGSFVLALVAVWVASGRPL